MFGILLEDRIERKMKQVRMLVSSVVIEVDEVFNVVMRTNVFYILQRNKQTKYSHLKNLVKSNFSFNVVSLSSL